MTHSSNHSERIAELILRQLQGEISSEEATELQHWVGASSANQAFFTSLNDPQKLNEEVLAFFESKQRIYQQIQLSLPKPKVISFNWKKWMAAATVMGILVSSYFIFFHNEKNQPEIVKVETKDVEAPKITKATITLADGRKVSLDSLTTLAQDNVTITRNANGEVFYSGNASEIRYNTLINPRGSKVVQLTLVDGTKVWLNSESSLKYPTAFAGTTRNVEITGEAYFEVAKDQSKKFIVTANNLTTEVLGTYFNINTYPDESSSRVTLVEGSISVNKILIQPNQQAQLTASGINILNNVDVESVMAWKNGTFDFGGADVEATMRTLARWYDVEVVYEGPRPVANFRGTIARQENISEVLKMLEITKAVQFKVEGRKVIVTK
jgi:transmembrane sensor